MKRRIQLTVALLLGTGLGLALSEALFSWKHDRAFPHLNLYVPDTELGARLEPSSKTRLRIADNPATDIRINEHGYRGGPWPSPTAEEVLLLGDSQAFGLGVNEEDTLAAELSRRLKQTVLNLGVPTYGPSEYRRVLEEVGRERKPRQVVLVINMANDVFEVNRPNRDRHAIWDGWAVRKETAPKKVANFPGRSWLFQRSHAVFELRRFWALRDPSTQVVAQSTLPSEASFRGFVAESARARAEHEASQTKNEQNQQAFRREQSDALERIRQADDQAIVRLIELYGKEGYGAGFTVKGVYEDGWVDATTRLRAARASPGDIVGEISYGEATGPYVATARAIRDAARFRASLEEMARLRQSLPEDTKARSALSAIQETRAVERQLDALLAAAPKRAVAWSPLKSELEKMKAVCAEWGAELIVVVLPLDVQVSEQEWNKYGGEHLPMQETEILNDDVALGARALGLKAVAPLAELRAVGPGAFLKGDLHLTAKGNRAVAAAVSQALEQPRALPLPSGGLPAGRKRVPSPPDLGVEALVPGSSSAHCETFYRNGWFRAVCRTKNEGMPLGVIWENGSGAEAASYLLEDSLSILVPVRPSVPVRAKLLWQDVERSLELIRASEDQEPHFLISPAQARTHSPPQTVRLSKDSELCRCAAAVYEAREARKKLLVGTDSSVAQAPDRFDCAREVFRSDAQCAATYAGRCEPLLACSNGDPWYAPPCEPGFANGGALERCLPLCGRDAPCAPSATCKPWQGAELCFPN